MSKNEYQRNEYQENFFDPQVSCRPGRVTQTNIFVSLALYIIIFMNNYMKHIEIYKIKCDYIHKYILQYI